MELNLPQVRAGLETAFAAYERALVDNDIATLDALFWDNGATVRYGGGENLYGIEAIRAFRSARSPLGLARELRHTVITTFGHDFGTCMTEFWRPDMGADGRIGRQSQTWVRMALPGHGGWRVVAAHVSVIVCP